MGAATAVPWKGPRGWQGSVPSPGAGAEGLGMWDRRSPAGTGGGEHLSSRVVLLSVSLALMAIKSFSYLLHELAC